MSVEQVRVHLWVSGRVQGVGFRAFVASAAGRMGITGWVRNVGYDTVEALAEGSRLQVDQFVEMVNLGPRSSRSAGSNLKPTAQNLRISKFVPRAKSI